MLDRILVTVVTAWNRTPVTVLKRTPVTMLNSAADDKNDCWYVEHLVSMYKSYSQCGNIVSKKEND